MTTLQIALAHDQRPFGGMDVLVYYDGPQLFWLPFNGRRLLALSLPNDAGKWPFLVVELTDTQAQDLEGNRLTVRAACLAAQARWVMRDYDAQPLVLEPLDTVPADWLPGDVLLNMDGGEPCQ
jgi:hypothetical protein